MPRPLKLSTQTSFLGAVALFMLSIGKNHAWFSGATLSRAIECTNYKHENTGAGHIFKSACWHLNRRISTGPCRMKTIKWSYIMESSRLFIFRSQIIFWRSSSTSTVYFNVNNVTMTSFGLFPRSWSLSGAAPVSFSGICTVLANTDIAILQSQKGRRLVLPRVAGGGHLLEVFAFRPVRPSRLDLALLS